MFIFCDDNAENIAALKKRVEAVAPKVKVDFIIGDSNSSCDSDRKSDYHSPRLPTKYSH